MKRPLTKPLNSSEDTSYQEDVELITNVITELRKHHRLKMISTSSEVKIAARLGAFRALKHYDGVRISQAFEMEASNRPAYLVLIVINSSYPGIGRHRRRVHVTEYELVGLLRLDRHWGEVIIRPETLEDKIAEQLTSTTIEVDFDFDKKFSRRYHVYASDEEKLRASISATMTNAIGNHRGLNVEASGHNVLVRIPNRVTLNNALIVAEVVAAIAA